MIPLSGPGLGLPIPQNLYPTELYGAPYDSPTNRVCLQPGEQLPLPAGDWFISMGGYLVIQYLDPLTNTWTYAAGTAHNRGVNIVSSDGFSVRLANLTGCPGWRGGDGLRHRLGAVLDHDFGHRRRRLDVGADRRRPVVGLDHDRRLWCRLWRCADHSCSRAAACRRPTPTALAALRRVLTPI